MAQTPTQRVIDALAERLQRSVVIDDPNVRLLYASQHYGDEDEVRTHAMLQRRASSAAIGHVLAQGVSGWSAPGVIPPNDDIGMHARVCCPIRWRGELIGLLLVVDAEGTITTSELSTIAAAGAELAPLLAAERESDADPGSAAVQEAVGDLLGESSLVRLAALRTLAERTDLRGFARARVVRLEVRPAESATDSHVAAALRFGLDPGSPELSRMPSLVSVQGHHGTAIVGAVGRSFSEEQAGALAGRLVARVHEVAADRFECVAGVGSEVDGLERVWASHNQAALACRSAAKQRQPVGSWANLGPMAILLHLPAEHLHLEALPAEMQRVLAADKDGRLLETLRVFLEHAGSIPATSEALHVHRTTLYYRLDKLTELAQIDLNDGDTRLSLHMSLKLLDDGALRQ
ncbi:helix-turn-helix domain-containing protein [Nocardioides islandensis]|uniref:Helix-turn-helix domain-containing protein n=1 Tax=Nocardioides islandensis TaxID=433663 RepID=A0A930VBC0_9ACTN|nr:PucR family transcriptional regulator [Nocardioides islandensis]MBF4764379.1 helix-turn-helix domain-containing protein [Nocardioides islandensis]